MQSDEIVLLSGGSRGLGVAIAEKLLQDGLRVATFSRSRTPHIDQLSERFPDKLHFVHADMGDVQSIEAVVTQVEKNLGPIGALINNAGIALDGLLATMREDHIEKLISVNFTGSIRLTRAVLRVMIPRRRGNIINISSIIGLRGYSGLVVYSATKAGLDGMTRALAREAGVRNIRVNSLAPGYLETEMTHGLDPKQRGQIVRRTPLGRLGKTSDVVGAITFLLSDQASFITGQTLVIDGGITC
jgi:3-oxoacyl-[acyl-carrier protein] reductase